MNKIFRDQADVIKRIIDSMLKLNDGWLDKMDEYQVDFFNYTTESQEKIV